MKPSIYRRIRRRTASNEAVNSKKENKQESSFFGEAATEHFFQPASVVTQTPVINRKCADCEQEDKKVQRAEDKKDEDKNLQRMTDKKEEEKVQRQPEKKEEKLMKKSDEKEEEKIQKKEAGNSTSAPVTSSYISSLNSKGTPLPKQAQQFFGSRMGYDFSNVKVHTDQEAAQSAKEVNAKAYTTGKHIVFNEGQYNTESTEGKKLMAHELAHVVQQESSKNLLQRKVSYPAPSYKKEDPIQKILASRSSKLGQTFITLNGVRLNTKHDAMKAIFEAFNNNISLIHDPVAKSCKVDTSKVDIKMSAEITITTDPKNDKWSGIYPGHIVSGSATCSKLPSVKIEMLSVPSGGTMLAGSVWIDEMQHYVDMLDISKKHIETFHTYLDNLSFPANTLEDCPAAFSAAIGQKDILMATAFADDWLAAVQVHDKPGGAHHYRSVTNATNCNMVTITVSF